MSDFRVGYVYSLAPIHCGGEGDLGNVLEIARETHTNYPYAPGSSLRGTLRETVVNSGPDGQTIADRLFGQELDDSGKMGVHQVWFGDARLLWVPMRTMSLSGSGDAFTWVSCHSLIRDHALLHRQSAPTFRRQPVGIRGGNYIVADAKLQVTAMTDVEKAATQLTGNWADVLEGDVKQTWENNRIVLPDSDFEALMEHALWTQIRNKIQDSGSAEVFWTDVCIPRDTILYFPWGYKIAKQNPVTADDHNLLLETLEGLFQIGGQANVGRGWVQGWVTNNQSPVTTAASPVSVGGN
jgi:CRISPR-associated protein Cmr4